MLKHLYIKNYALIDELEVSFDRGLNIITGETGAGKSIIIGAMGLLLGDRAQTESVRQGSEKAVVEGIFNVPDSALKNIRKFTDSDKSELIIRREIFANGRSRAFVNDSPVTGSVISLIGNYIADLHGQHQHQALLNTATHIEYIDSFGVNSDLLEKLDQSFKRYQKLKKKLDELNDLQNTAKQKQELLEFQVKQIEEINPGVDEEEELLREEKLLANAEKIVSIAGQLYKMLYEDDDSVSVNLSKASGLFEQITAVDSSLSKWMQECDSARIAVEEISKFINDYASSVEFDPERLEQIRDRLGAFTLLKKKYGHSVNEVLNFYKNAKKELGSIENVETEIAGIKKSIDAELALLSELCVEVSKKRKEVSQSLKERVESALSELGLKKASFEIKLSQKESENGPVFINDKGFDVTGRGIDSAEFYISLNSGEDVKPLSKIASGGEISRIMLALKTVFADTDNIPVLIFDEIDNGISGRIARIVGKKLKEVSENHQVICITHLAQIASLGDRHYSVIKKPMNGRTVTSISALSDSDRVSEIAKLIGGESITESTIQSAKELIYGEK